jgi:hypothetical protein
MNSAGTAACDVVQAVQTGGKVYGGDFEYGPESGYACTSQTASSAWYRWGYPAGGMPQRSTAPLSSSSVPNGVTISHS